MVSQADLIESVHTVLHIALTSASSPEISVCVTVIAPVSVFLGELYSYTILVEDPDDDQFTYQISGYPEGMVLNDNVVSWNPTEDNQIGLQGPITVTVSDGGEDGAIAAIEVFMVEVQYNYLVANYDLYEGNNLISFYSIPPNNPIINSSDSLNFVFDSLKTKKISVTSLQDI